MRHFIEDLRFGARVLRKTPGLTAVAILTLAVGIAANTTVFSWIDAILLHPLPGVADVPRLVVVETTTASGEVLNTSVTEYRHFRDNVTLLDGLAGAHGESFAFGPPESGQRVWGEMVTPNYFEVLGVRPALGRFFAPQELGDAPGGYPLAVISHRLWRTRFHSDPRVLGKTVRVNGHDLTVIGIAPAEFRGTVNGLTFELWVPVAMAKELSIWNDTAFRYRASRGVNSIGRLKPGVTVEQVRAQLAASARQLDAISPETARGFSAIASPVWQAHYGAADLLYRPLQILMAVSLVLLLIVCGNVANLLLARAVSRRKEIAVRLAMGARRGRIVRQLLTETLVLAAAGVLAALPLALWMQDLLVWLIPRVGFPIALTTGFNTRVFLFTFLICGLAALVSGVTPALHAGRADVNESLKESARGSHSGRRSHRTRSLLVVGEVALAALALIGAGLFVRSFEKARSIHPGFDPRGVLLAQFYPSGGSYTELQVRQFSRRLRERLSATPGLEMVSYSDSVPLGTGSAPFHSMVIEGYAPAPTEDMKVHRTLVSPGFFRLMRIPLVEGRDFTDGDVREEPRVMVVNETFVRRFFGGGAALGRKVRVEGRWFSVVGVVKDCKYDKPAEAPQPFFYLSFDQWFNTGLSLNFLLRSPGDPNRALPLLRRAVAAIDPNLSAFHAVPLQEYESIALYPQRVAASLLGALGLLCLLLAALGLYSVMSYAVSQRTQEIGLRMAVGARPRDVLRMVAGQGMALTAAGLAAGIAAAFCAAPLIGGMLVNTGTADPLAFICAPLFLAAVALLATWIPARRATRVEPLTALRCE